MQALERLNLVVKYIEENLENGVDYKKLAEIACCSQFHLQRMFPYTTGMTIGEYTRRRRMTKAAMELIEGGKILDVALKYGYNSPTAFNRAFRSVHGVSPSEAKRAGTKLKLQGPLSFKITIKGVEEMEFRIEEKKGFRAVGLKTELKRDMSENFGEIPKLWNQAAGDGRLEKLIALTDGDVLGISVCLEESLTQEPWSYYIAVPTEKAAGDGFEEFQVEGGTWAVFEGEGEAPGAIQEVVKRALTEWLPASGYEYAPRAEFERYLTRDPKNAKFEYWLPVRRSV